MAPNGALKFPKLLPGLTLKTLTQNWDFIWGLELLAGDIKKQEILNVAFRTL